MNPLLPLLLAAAAPFADLAQIDRAVTEFTGTAAQPVDRRLKLAPCRNPLSLGWHAGRRDTVLVQCPDPGGWRLFVPVPQQAAAAQQAPAILRGEAVTVLVAGNGFSVAQPGHALESGAVNTWIRIKTAAAEPLRAQVVRPGLVKVDLGTDLP